MSEDNQNVPQMRETIERLSKEKAGLQKEVSDLQKEVRVRDAREAFRVAGYDPRQGDLFATSRPDAEISSENVLEFAEEYNLSPKSSGEEAPSEEDSTSDSAQDDSDLSAFGGSGSRSGDGGAGGADVKTLTRQEWQNLYSDDPVAAKQAIASGRVEISKDNPWARGGATKSTGNPYVQNTTDA